MRFSQSTILSGPGSIPFTPFPFPFPIPLSFLVSFFDSLLPSFLGGPTLLPLVLWRFGFGFGGVYIYHPDFGTSAMPSVGRFWSTPDPFVVRPWLALGDKTKQTTSLALLFFSSQFLFSVPSTLHLIPLYHLVRSP
ncbi:hypothetical protein DFP72DRAFT_909706, partial [Ephemerocybe angulata]